MASWPNDHSGWAVFSWYSSWSSAFFVFRWPLVGNAIEKFQGDACAVHYFIKGFVEIVWSTCQLLPVFCVFQRFGAHLQNTHDKYVNGSVDGAVVIRNRVWIAVMDGLRRHVVTSS